jgi:hypothetical protein
MSWRKGSNLTWLRGLAGVRQGEPLATRTSFGIGGPAEYFAEMSNPQSIQVVLDGCRLRGIPYLLLGAARTCSSPTGGSRVSSFAWSTATTEWRARASTPVQA